MSSIGAAIGKPARRSTSMSNLAFWQHLQHAGIGQQRRQRRDRVGQRDLRRQHRRGAAARSRRGPARWPARSRPACARIASSPSVSVSSADDAARRRLGHPGAQRLDRGDASRTGRNRRCDRRRRRRRRQIEPALGAGVAPASASAAAAAAGALQPEAGDDAAEPLRASARRPAFAGRRPRHAAPPAAAAAARRRAASPARGRCAPCRRARSACRAASTASSPARRPARASRSPNSLMSCAAVFGPMPGTPGTLSTRSPISACTSISLSGGRRTSPSPRPGRSASA